MATTKGEGERCHAHTSLENRVVGEVQSASPAKYNCRDQHSTKLKFSYIHPSGVKQPNFCLKLKRRTPPYIASRPSACDSYEIFKVDNIGEETCAQRKLIVGKFEDLVFIPKIHDVYSRLEYPKPTSVYPVQLRSDYRDDIYERLRGGLRWLHENGLSAQLEGRFGKVVFQKCQNDEVLDVAKFVNLATKDIWFSLTQFITKVLDQIPFNLKKTCLQRTTVKQTTYMISIESKSDNDSLNIRIEFKDGKPDILYARKGWSSKRVQVQFDILCLHRKHDMRVSLSSVEKSSVDDPSVVHYVAAAIEMPEPGIIRYNPLASEKWHITYIRHQEWESYKWREPYVVDISAIGDYHIIDPSKSACFDIKVEDFNKHYEVELHHALWDSLDAQSSDQYVHPHTCGSTCDLQGIIKELERDTCTFLQAMDDLNDAMEEM